MDSLTSHFSHIKIAQSGIDQVHKDECICSFDTPESDGGLYVCMKTFQAIGRDFLDYYYHRYGHTVYLHLKRMKYKIDKPESSESKPKRLAIGIDGGFDPDANAKDFRYEDVNSIVIMPSRTEIPLPNPDLPELVLQSVSSILIAESAECIQERSVGDIWDGEKRKVSVHSSSLEQLTPAPRVPPSGWKCEKCDLRENLWLNLTDGSILCGRRFFDGTGGNNHAVEHYQEYRYPLAVKLGTITENGADVYSYPEEDMVENPNLAKHLAHFGIDIQTLTKTEKSMIELEIDMNQRIGEWSIIQEEGHKLEPISGPGYTGLINLGNSCYMNSVLQVFFSLKEFQDRYYPSIPIYQVCDGPAEFNHQMAKLAYGLLSGRYSDPDPFSLDAKVQLGIAPKSFKHYVCGQNANFSTKRQQDAQEFFLYLIDLIERNDSDGRSRGEQSDQKPSKNTNPTKAFEFVVEDRFQCTESKKVKYTHRVDYCLPLHVDLDLATNKSEVDKFKILKAAADAATGPNVKQPELVRPKIDLVECIDQFSRPETLKDFYSSATSSYTTATKTTKISRFPKYFVFQMKKFQLGDDWVPRKLDVAFNVPHMLDLSELTATGLQPDEEELEEETTQDNKKTPMLADSYGIQASAEALFDWPSPKDSDLSVQRDQSSFTPSKNDSHKVSIVIGKLMEMGYDIAECQDALYKNPESELGIIARTIMSSTLPEFDEQATKLPNSDQLDPNVSLIEPIQQQLNTTETINEPTSDCLADAQTSSSAVSEITNKQSEQSVIVAAASTGENSRGTKSIEPDPEAMSILLSMGIDETQAITALKASNNDPQRAIDYIFNPPPTTNSLAVAIRHDAFKLKLFKPDTGPKFYQLKAFISHMGTSTMCGHYVCHIKKDDRWVIFNDSKVSISEEPPTELGYLYLYERMSWSQ